MQGKKLTGTKYLPGQVLEDADLLTHSLALQKQADEAAGVNQSAASNLKPLLQKHQTLASSATLPQQQAWHLHKGLQLLQDARDDGIVPGEDAERLGDDFKSSLAQDQANLLLATAPHAIAQALHTNPLLVGLNPQDRQRLEQRAERRLHSLPLDHQHQQQQALLHQTGNRLKNWFNRSYDYLGKAGQLSPSELADLELTQALPQHTLNLLSQLSAHAVKQSAKHQAYLNRIQQGFKDQPLDPHNPDDLQAADYHFLLNHGKDSDQQLAGALPDLFRLTKIIPKSAKPALNRLIHGHDGLKFSQRLAEAWQTNPSLAAQLPDEVLAHNFAASTLLPDWQLGGAADPHNRLYNLLTSPTLPPVPTSQDPTILGQQTAQRIIALRQIQADLQTLEYQAAHHPDQM
ncbi:MAG: hypothetical protein IPP67_03660, partial [Rhodospirillaceae bacterium]|nr:hypothetical protein [Rhodospirillaceae bacterium]